MEREETVAGLVEAAAARSPDSTAVVAGDESLTYAELDARAGRLARHLRSSGVGPGVGVGVCLHRSLDLAVALLAVLKAGGACVPLDPAYPPERLAFMVDDAGVAAVVTRSELSARLPAAGTALIDLDAGATRWAGPLARWTCPDDVAYVIYTSGSTGRPKGVMLTHRGLVHHHRAAIDLYRLAPGDRVLQFCSIGFDASIEELFPTWAAGATVVFRPDDVPLLGRPWLGWLRRHGVTVLNLPTAYWHAWTADLDARGEPVPDDIRLVVVGGEKAAGPTLAAWLRVSGRRSRWINAYGPTETTCMSTFYEPAPDRHVDSDADPPIGRPLPGTDVAVVDEALRPVPAGATGELLIGGAGLARGYLHDPAMTAERFVAVATVGARPVRMYRTGDLVRRRPDDELDYVGRIDDQVKIRGFRIEPGEIEAALTRHPAVAAAAVVARHDPPADKQLVAYVAHKRGAVVTPADLRRSLRESLPAHMVPAAFVVLDALPVTAGGKVDRAALPAPARTVPGAAGGTRSATEDRVAAIWARVLGLDAADLRPGDNFFELGGHSLLATQVIAHLREELGTDTPLRAIFEAPTIAGLAAAVAQGAGGAAGGARLAPRSREPGARLPLSLAQEQMWALEAAADPPGLYNFTALHRFAGPVDEGVLAAAVAHLVERHEILRTAFLTDAGGPYQLPRPEAAVDLIVADLRSEPAGRRQAELARRVAAMEAKPFDLSRPPLVRLGLFRIGDGSTRLAVTFDHLVSDGTGASVFLRELLAAYEAMAAGRTPSLPPPGIQFADFAVWQRASVTDEVLGRQLLWWAGALEGMPLGPVVAFDRFPDVPTRRIASTAVAVPAGTRAALETVARETGSTVFVAAVAAVAAVLGRSGGSTDVVVSTTLSGRNRAEMEDLVGMFSGISRIRVDLAGDPAFTTLVDRARDWVLGMFENQDVPFMRVRRHLLPDFPTRPLELAAALPVELQFFHTGDAEMFFRGQLHPLSITLIDDDSELSAQVSYKLDFYRPETIDRLAADLARVLGALASDPSLRFGDLPVSPPEPR